jgi:hypothetical protein
MFALHGRKALFAALLATALSAPAAANDSVNTTQQTSVGQMAAEAASLQTRSSIVKQGYATEANSRAPAPSAPPAASIVPLPPTPTARQPSVVQHTPLILGIRH